MTKTLNGAGWAAVSGEVERIECAEFIRARKRVVAVDILRVSKGPQHVSDNIKPGTVFEHQHGPRPTDGLKHAVQRGDFVALKVELDVAGVETEVIQRHDAAANLLRGVVVGASKGRNAAHGVGILKHGAVERGLSGQGLPVYNGDEQRQRSRAVRQANHTKGKVRYDPADTAQFRLKQGVGLKGQNRRSVVDAEGRCRLSRVRAAVHENPSIPKQREGAKIRLVWTFQPTAGPEDEASDCRVGAEFAECAFQQIANVHALENNRARRSVKP